MAFTVSEDRSVWRYSNHDPRIQKKTPPIKQYRPAVPPEAVTKPSHTVELRRDNLVGDLQRAIGGREPELRNPLPGALFIGQLGFYVPPYESRAGNPILYVAMLAGKAKQLSFQIEMRR